MMILEANPTWVDVVIRVGSLALPILAFFFGRAVKTGVYEVKLNHLESERRYRRA